MAEFRRRAHGALLLCEWLMVSQDNSGRRLKGRCFRHDERVIEDALQRDNVAPIEADQPGDPRR